MEVPGYRPLRAENVYVVSPLTSAVVRGLYANALHLAGDRIRIAVADSFIDGQGSREWVSRTVTAGGGDALVHRVPIRLTRNAGDVMVYVFCQIERVLGSNDRPQLLARIGRYTDAALTADIVTTTQAITPDSGEWGQPPANQGAQILPFRAIPFARGQLLAPVSVSMTLSPVRTTSLDQMVELYLDDAQAARAYFFGLVVAELPVRVR